MKQFITAVIFFALCFLSHALMSQAEAGLPPFSRSELHFVDTSAVSPRALIHVAPERYVDIVWHLVQASEAWPECTYVVATWDKHDGRSVVEIRDGAWAYQEK